MPTDFTKYGKSPAQAAAQPQAQGAQPQAAATSSFAKYGKPVDHIQQAVKEKDKSIARMVGDFFTGNTQAFGKTIGESIAAPGNADKFAESSQLHSEVTSNIVKKIAEKRAKGEDATKFENLLKEHEAQAPKLEDFTGDVINKTTGQVLGEAGGTLLEVLPFGTYGKAAKGMKAGELATKLTKAPSIIEQGVKAITKPKALLTKAGLKTAGKAAAEGAAVGYAADVTSGLQNKEGGAAFKPGVGTAVGALLPIAAKGTGSALESFASKRASKVAAGTEELVKKVAQTDTDAVKAVSNTLKQVDLKGAKTYEEATTKLNKAIKDIKGLSNKALDTNPYDKPVSELALKTKVGNQEISHNYVEDAMSQLRKHYESVNDRKGLAEIDQLMTKGANQGLSVREIDELAVRHGRDLTGFNANGELSSGLSKQASENTRKGLKATAREQFGNKVYNEADSTISDLITTRDLFEELSIKAQKAQNKVREMGLKEKVGSLLEKAINVGTLGTSRGLLDAVSKRLNIPGNETMKILEIQKNLQKSISKLDDIFKAGEPVEKTVDKLNAYLKETGFQAPKNQKKMPAKPAKIKK